MTKPSRRKHYSNVLATCVLAAGLVSCAPVIHNHGYVFDELDLSVLKSGQTTADAVKSMLGTPTTTSVIDGQAFFYIYSHYQRQSYKAPQEMDRIVLAIYFDEQNKVKSYKQYGLDDGKVVAFVDRSTETSGKELTVIEQLLGNLGRVGSGDSGTPGVGR